MPNQHAEDYLSRALARSQISNAQYAAGRRFQEICEAVESGNDQVVVLLDKVFNQLQQTRFELMLDVLCCLDVGTGAPSALARAAAKRGLDPRTSSRDMKSLGWILRSGLQLLADVLTTLELPSGQLPPNIATHECHTLRLIREHSMLGAELGSVRISTPETVQLALILEPIQALAHAKGFHVAPSDEEKGLFNLVLRARSETRLLNVTLFEIDRELKRFSPKVEPPRRKRGARGRAPVTLAKHA
jgi:hypothetical protein